ncbi:hypothetical protein GQ44DRAFT_605203 [Phaeosphaeriaceae sp. PMI808]|nr:hypothetical protein GQ44DRAFT_605203 [Phaeosphaeriaceae sp. PMI808]
MAATTQPWLEDLSEEWIPQDTLPAPAKASDSSAAPTTSQSIPPKPRSRLPRLRQSSTSFSEIQVNAKGLCPSKRRNTLAERSLSDTNVALTSPDSSFVHHDITTSNSFSMSQGSVLCGTVAHNTIAKSPTKHQGAHDTPEWRRRLVKGELGYGDQTDLFGNTGLQNIFQKPAENTSDDTQQQPQRKLGLLKSFGVMPSSPPPWSATELRNNDDHDQHDRQDSPLEDSVQEQDESSVIHAPNSATQDAIRTTSGQIEFENESFSPVYLTTNLKIGQPSNQSTNFRGSELANRLRQIGSPLPNQYQSITEESSLSHSREDSSFARLQDESLPEGLPAGTPDFAGVSRFVELRRGGYSRDGSFRRRPLSPSPGKGHSSEGGNAEQSQTQKKHSAGDEASPGENSSDPKTPRRHGHQFLSPERAKNSGSPLKLFDAHDTFTSNRLQRRLSQLEHKSDKTNSNDQVTTVEGTKMVQKTSSLTSVEEVSFLKGDAENAQNQSYGEMGTFGRGHLTEYQFSGDSFDHSFDGLDLDSGPDGSPSLDVAPPGSRQPFKFHFQRHQSKSTAKIEEHLEVQYDCVDGKRGPTSPCKDPIPKRRRTIPSSGEGGEEDEEEEDEGTVASESGLQSLHAEIIEATEAFILSSPKLNTIREQLESPAKSDNKTEEARATAIANEVAAFSMKKQKVKRDESRKRSVTTQDFLDEAVKIMNFIRTKGRPSSGLGSLEETEAESEFNEYVQTHPSSSLTFERPPSREGRTSAWKEPNKQQLDPSVINHLRKYQEKESDTFLNSSVNSLRFAHVRASDTPEEESVVVEQNDIRITDNPNRHTRANSAENPVGSQPRTTGTQGSLGSSLGQTIATSASRRSDHVATLAPEAVAHLIPQEVAGMSFDREKNMWVRQKSPSKERRYHEEEPSHIQDSEDDPFGNIPDLTVDDINEHEGQASSPVRPKPTAETILEDTEQGRIEEERPVTREGKGIPFTDTSSAPSKVSNFAWSYPKTETRATSWSTQAPRNWSTQKAPQPQITYAIPESDEDDIEHEIQYFEGRGHAPANAQNHRIRDITISITDRDVENIDQRTICPNQEGQTRRPASNAHQKTHRKPPTQSQLRAAKSLPHTRPNGAPVFNGDGDLSLLDELPSKPYRMQLSMNVSAPVLTQNTLAAPSSPIKGDVTFMLSDLPEFTLNQIDECHLPNRVVVKHDGTRFSKALEDRYAQGTADLVKALQDAEPDEPYWEDLRKVDLHNKGLSTLHRLDELCFQLEELVVSNNGISQVEGIPYTMRRLQAQNNCLNGLTSWNTLANLQHLDISNNEIDSLDGLAELIHIRVLKVNNNKVKSLDSILHLDGLMELNNNEIEEFPLFDGSAERCKSLRSLSICQNGLISLDVDGHFPRLETLHIDGNCLTHVRGLEHLRHLRTFSARDQIQGNESDAETCISNLIRNCDVRNLYLSLNPTQGLEIPQHLLNLQRLELSSMGLKELPDNFGQLTPNIRSINLNFNSIKDIRPLLNIKRLDTLLLAGNKLERLRANAMVLGRLGTLSKLDWRDNPLTLRFYASTSENRIMSLRQKPSDEQLTDRFVLPDQEAEADSQHLSRLDNETRMRRRVTEMMLANLCKNLRELDGLTFDKTRILVKDDIWERMLLLGVIQRKQSEDTSNHVG